MNQELTCLHRFYDGLRHRDFLAIRACYHAQARFTDPVFDLQGAAVPAMWHMLLAGGTDLEFTVDLALGPQQTRWEPIYTFSATGRPVHNVIESAFTFRDGHILRQIDRFDFRRWAGMALGPMGVVLGWTPWLRTKVQRGANARLDAFLLQHPEYVADSTRNGLQAPRPASDD